MAVLEYLDLSCNGLDGSIPQSFGNMTALEYLDLSQNGLDGSIPQSFGNMNALEYLYLSYNGLDGFIPQSFGNMTALEFLDLSGNELEGSIPQSFGNMTALEHLDLSSNKLEGEIPKSIWRVCTLRELRASDNSLAGELHLAESSTRCANFPLEELKLGNNQIMGSLPNFTMYPSLITLRLGSNKLDGVVSKSILQLSKLEVLDISENFVADVISEAHFSKLINLRFLDLSSNSKIVFEISPDWIPPFQLEEISLGSVNLGRHFPKWLQTQKSYSVLDISNSGIAGSIPNWFWTNLSTNTFKISLNLSNNGISALAHNNEVVDNLHGVDIEIDLSSNQLKGSIPLFLLQVATSLYLLNNKFSGLNSICNDTRSLPLEFLDVSNNQLSGELPDCWSYAEDLRILNLKNNSLTGKIPISIGFLTQMLILRLSNNHLIGKLPSSLKNCTFFKVLDIGENNLSGKIPAWIGKSINLIVLSIRSNNFYGSIPSQLCHLQSLQLLDLSSNWLSSGIPTCLGNITAMKEIGSNPQFVYNRYVRSRYLPIPPIENDILRLVWKGVVSEFKNAGFLRNIDLSSNKLIGVIPNEVTELVGLVSLNLSRNNLSGEIPQKIGELKSLDVLDLSMNHLSGVIPSSLSQISGLSTLDLSNNSLSGKIPMGTQLQTRDAAAYFGNPELCGDPLSKKCPGEDEPTTSRASEDHGDDQDNEDQLITKGFYISSAVGFIVAFWGFCLALIFNKSWRYRYLKSLNNAEDWLYVTVAVNKAKLLRIIKS